MKEIILIPCNETNGIDQTSSDSDILNSKDCKRYTVEEFCQDCNDELIDIGSNWVFYIETA